MATWTGNWEFNNSMNRNHGKIGSEKVSADTESEAKQKVKEAASRRLFNTTAFQTYVEVRKLRQSE